MAIPSYAYLKLKIPEPARILIVEAQSQRMLDCEHNSILLTTAELRELNLQLHAMPHNLGMPLTSGAFKADEDTKAV
jgi:hypothetical protein